MSVAQRSLGIEVIRYVFLLKFIIMKTESWLRLLENKKRDSSAALVGVYCWMPEPSEDVNDDPLM